jgi:uncharacterized protein (TIGR03083 family)
VGRPGIGWARPTVVGMIDVGLPVSHGAYTSAVDRLGGLTAWFASTVARLRDWNTTVPGCPGWTVRDLVVHLGTIHGWATAALDADHEPEESRYADPTSPLPDWYRARAAGLLAALGAREPASAAWTPFDEPVAAFWARRMMHETAIHCHDLAAALSGTADPAPSPALEDLALDGLNEVLYGFYPRQVRLGRTQELPGVIRFEATGHDGQTTTLDTKPIAPAADIREERLLATIPGTPVQLYLGVWGRAPFPGVAPHIAELLQAPRLTP